MPGKPIIFHPTMSRLPPWIGSEKKPSGTSLSRAEKNPWASTVSNFTSQIYTSPNTNSDWFGYAIAALGDVEGDGYPDFAVGAPLASSKAGKVYVYRGGTNLGSLSRSTVFTGATDDYGGKALAGDFDANGDGWTDLLVGLPGHGSTDLGEAVLHLGYRDADGDGIPYGTDCDDSSKSTGGPTTWYVDADGDGYGVATTTTAACTQPSGYAAVSTDCDDTTSARSPGNTEVCVSGNVDEDCDGLSDDADPSALDEDRAAVGDVA